MRRILNTLFKFYLGFFFALSLLILYPIFYFLLQKRKYYKRVFIIKKYWAKFLLGILFIRPKAIQKVQLPDGPFVLCSNHQSYIDIILMYTVIDRPFIFIGKHELLHWPLFNIFFKTMDIAVNRKNPVEAKRALDRAANELANGWPIAIFPEGTIHLNTPQMHKLKGGAFKIAIEQNVPVVPVTIVDNWKRFSDPTNFNGSAGPGLSRYIIHPPIYPGNGDARKEIVALRNKTTDVIGDSLEKVLGKPLKPN